MEDINGMSEEQVRIEIESIERSPEFLRDDLPHRTSQSRADIMQRRTALYDRLYPTAEPEDGQKSASEPSGDLVNAMREGLALRQEKIESQNTAIDERYQRGKEIFALVDAGNLEQACTEIRRDLVDWGIPQSELQLVDGLSEIVNDKDVSPEVAGIMEDFLYLVYDLRRKKTRG